MAAAPQPRVDAGRVGPTGSQVAAQRVLVTLAAQGGAAGPTLSVKLALASAGGEIRLQHARAWVTGPDGYSADVPGVTATASADEAAAWLRLPTGPALLRDQTVQLQVSWRGDDGRPRQTAAGPLRLGGLAGPDVRKTLLPSGLRVLTVERPDAPSVSVNVAVNAGMRDEDPATIGAAHWLEHAFFLGTVNHPDPRYFARYIEGLGGTWNGWTWIEQTHYWVSVPTDQFGAALAALAALVTVPAFNRTAVDRERRVVQQEALRRANTPGIAAFDAAMEQIFRVHPARNSGAKEVPDVSIEAMLRFRDRYYVTGNTVVSVVGAVTHDAAVAAVAERFADLPPGPANVRPPVAEPKPDASRRVERGQGRSQAQIALGWPAAGLDSPDRYVALVLDAVMDRPGRRLYRSLRTERQLVTEVSTAVEQFADAGYWQILAQTSPDRVDAAITGSLDEVRRLRDEGPTRAEVDSAIGFTQGTTLLRWETTSDQADRMSEAEAGGFLESVDDLVAGLQAVTPADVQRYAREHFDPERYAVAVVRT